MITMRQFLNRFIHTGKLIRRGPSSQDVVKVCPICLRKSIEIQPNFLTFLTPTIYHCRQCDYNGPILAEIEREEYEKLDFEDLARVAETSPTDTE
jgi:hypothetical protein